MNQIENDANCEMFCQTMKWKCNTIGLILILFCIRFIVVSSLTNLKHYSLGLFVGNLFLEIKQHYLVVSTGTSEETFAEGYCYIYQNLDLVLTAWPHTITNVSCHQQTLLTFELVRSFICGITFFE